MGRVKSLFKIFCLDRRRDQDSQNPYSQTDDVSHLATPPITITATTTTSSNNSTPLCERIRQDQKSLYHQDCDHNNHRSDVPDWSNDPTDQSPNDIAVITHHSPQLENNNNNNINNNNDNNVNSHNNNNNDDSHNESSQPSPPSASSMVHDSNGILNPQNSQIPSTSNQAQYIQQNQNNNDNNNNNNNLNEVRNNQSQSQNQNLPSMVRGIEYDLTGRNHNGPMTKLSYDIISVREPLAKILAERQQFQNQRQLLTDHEYIEVYGERGSSCFYEEIAGSTTSSATYDQIGAVSNHNYQVLANAYAVNRPNDNYDRGHYELAGNSQDENDGSINPYSEAVSNGPSNFRPQQNELNFQANHSTEPPQSVPLYSVINKAKLRSNNPNTSKINDRSYPPEPPPKNLLVALKPNPSAIHYNNHLNYQQINNQNNNDNHLKYQQINQLSSGPRSLSPSNPNSIQNNPSSSSISTTNLINTNHQASSNFFRDHTNSPHVDSNSNIFHIPKPPPRLSKQSIYNFNSNRPLPLPDSSERDIPTPIESTRNNNDLKPINNQENDPNKTDTDSNGYELLTPAFDDDQIDVGYEKIGDLTDRGSLASQLCNLHALENGGYESVQPIYSSPTNALIEPNYEAITPAKASEMAAAATAKLNTVAKVLGPEP